MFYESLDAFLDIAEGGGHVGVGGCHLWLVWVGATPACLDHPVHFRPPIVTHRPDYSDQEVPTLAG